MLRLVSFIFFLFLSSSALSGTASTCNDLFVKEFTFPGAFVRNEYVAPKIQNCGFDCINSIFLKLFDRNWFSIQVKTPKVMEHVRQQMMGLSEVEIRSVIGQYPEYRHSIDLAHLNTTVNANKQIIIVTGFYNLPNTKSLSSHNIITGRTFLVDNYDPALSNKITLRDVEDSDRVLSGRLTQIQPYGFQSHSYQIILDHFNDPARTLAIQSVVLIEPQIDSK